MKRKTFKCFVTVLKFADSQFGELARDILWDDNFPIAASREQIVEYFEKDTFLDSELVTELLKLFDEWLPDTEEPIEFGQDPDIKRMYKNVEVKGNRCLSEDDVEVIRTLKVPCGLYKSHSPDLVTVMPFPRNVSTIQHQAVEVYANYFRREFQYDFVQYCSESDQYNWRERHQKAAFLFTDTRGPSYRGELGTVNTVGACCFRYTEDKEHLNFWAMQWIWLHPYYRRSGILTRHWELFCQNFYPFLVETPLSNAMKAFLEKRSYGHDEPLHPDKERLLAYGDHRDGKSPIFTEPLWLYL